MVARISGGYILPTFFPEEKEKIFFPDSIDKSPRTEFISSDWPDLGHCPPLRLTDHQGQGNVIHGLIQGLVIGLTLELG